MLFPTKSLKHSVSAIILCSFSDESTGSPRYKGDFRPLPQTLSGPNRDARPYHSQDHIHKKIDYSSTKASPWGYANREELTDALYRALGAQNTPHNPNLYDSFSQCDFIYDIMLLTRENSLIRRRMVVDFETDIDIMSEAVFRKLNVKMSGFTGNGITWWNRPSVKPLGTVQASWRVCGREKVYSTEFYVISDTEFDLLLGTTSVRKLGLYRADPGVATRLRSSG
ncbi:hypothetical protein P170DRAFT_420877 [Aspergillus steynii IBT 23096]|uniref:Uncharacterized protein n=1 Tax=Aspergillus steynii IBT 23096 TaxID=1392250 RepID=A0A2I2GMK3_9EURO|nr:uncharacterized protein P170DRAFT_420877 [Aspergillus steynii IBT 23096]PLB54103.1 hypothetical protein P170DRAFT_420877 [Aspergillus steynii IBT 23096]